MLNCTVLLCCCKLWVSVTSGFSEAERGRTKPALLLQHGQPSCCSQFAEEWWVFNAMLLTGHCLNPEASILTTAKGLGNSSVFLGFFSPRKSPLQEAGGKVMWRETDSESLSVAWNGWVTGEIKVKAAETPGHNTNLSGELWVISARKTQEAVTERNLTRGVVCWGCLY